MVFHFRDPRGVRRENVGLSDRSVRLIVHDELDFHPYKFAIAQELSERDSNARRNACEALLEHVFFSDDALFHSTGCVNKQNICYWSDNNLRGHHQRRLHSPRVTVGFIGPYYLL